MEQEKIQLIKKLLNSFDREMKQYARVLFWFSDPPPTKEEFNEIGKPNDGKVATDEEMKDKVERYRGMLEKEMTKTQ